MCTKETCIYYFSGTGNGLAAAKQLAEELGGAEITAVTRELVDSKPVIECEKCVLIFPAYAYGLPPLMRKFLKVAGFKCGYVAALATCGTTQGGAFAVAKRLLGQKGQKADYFKKIETVENYVHMFGFPKSDDITARVELQRTGVKIAAEMIKMRGTNKISTFHPFSALINSLFRSAKWMFARSYRVQDTCTGCGLCAAVCPAAAIKMENGKPKFSSRDCNHCQCCLNLCPQKAIKYMKIKPASPRYIHPEVTIKEFKKR